MAFVQQFILRIGLFVHHHTYNSVLWDTSIVPCLIACANHSLSAPGNHSPIYLISNMSQFQHILYMEPCTMSL